MQSTMPISTVIQRAHNCFRSIAKILLLSTLSLANPAAAANTAQQSIHWQPWSAELFSTAAAENRFVLLDLEAVWCHWCHVMDAKTYTDPQVIALLQQHYIAVKVDHDARPDLANRYRDYGWPATIIFAPDGTEIVKRAGYIAPDRMAALLQAVVRDPSPEQLADLAGAGNSTATSLPAALKQDLLARHRAAYDEKRGGLRLFQKFLDRDSVEYAMVAGARGDAAETARAQHTLQAATALLDPVWGGVYQYSTGGDWQHPHFEKLMRNQAAYLRIYALAYARYRKPEYLRVMNEIRRYVDTFLRDPAGVYYVSQDADRVQGEHGGDYFALDDAARLERGIPRIDRNVYAQENGWMIEALATVYAATGDPTALAGAESAAAWIGANLRDADGRFRHAADTGSGHFLGDNLAMARALLQLYAVTGERHWLTAARDTASLIDASFRAADGGYNSGADTGSPVPAVPNIDENISLARFSNLLFHYTGVTQFQAMNRHAIRYLTNPAVATSRFTEAGILLADLEQATDPLHLTIVGDKTDTTARRLFDTALPVAGWYKRLEWWDRNEGPLPNADVGYPKLATAAAFVCTEQRCSLPAFDAETLRARIANQSTAPTP